MSEYSDIIRAEADAILSIPVSDSYDAAVSLIVEHTAGRGGKLVVSGMGKAGQIGMNIATTFCSTGTPAVFLRFSGCNLQCDFCDTDHHSSTPMNLFEVIEALSVYPARHLVITGGEPSLQLDDTLVDALHGQGWYIQIETNGTNPLPETVDWVTCSPKSAPVVIKSVDELKVVYQGQDVEALAESIPAENLYLQPCSGKNIKAVVDYILTHPWWRLSLQTHKLIDIP